MPQKFKNRHRSTCNQSKVICKKKERRARAKVRTGIGKRHCSTYMDLFRLDPFPVLFFSSSSSAARQLFSFLFQLKVLSFFSSMLVRRGCRVQAAAQSCSSKNGLVFLFILYTFLHVTSTTSTASASYLGSFLSTPIECLLCVHGGNVARGKSTSIDR